VSASGSGCRHVSVLTFREGTTTAEIDAIAAALRALPEEIGVIRDYRVGSDLGIDDGNGHFVVVADFASPADYAVYRDHPAHRAVLAEVIRPLLASRAAAQYRL
jgi:stress responsive alpha/beta barrel protein